MPKMWIQNIRRSMESISSWDRPKSNCKEVGEEFKAEKMKDERYKEIMATTAYPESRSVFQALQQVANEVAQECAKSRWISVEDLPECDGWYLVTQGKHRFSREFVHGEWINSKEEKYGKIMYWTDLLDFPKDYQAIEPVTESRWGDEEPNFKGVMPCEPEAMVRVYLANDMTEVGIAGDFNWKTDIRQPINSYQLQII